MGRFSPLGSVPKLSLRAAVARQARTESFRRHLNFCSWRRADLQVGVPAQSILSKAATAVA